MKPNKTVKEITHEFEGKVNENETKDTNNENIIDNNTENTHEDENMDHES